MSFWKKYSRKQKIFFVILCLFFFIASNITMIFQGYCVSSPCPSLNQTSGMDGTWDRYGEVYIRPILAPTSLLIVPVLSSYGYETETYTDTLFRDPKNLLWFWLIPIVYQQTSFDLKDESFQDNGKNLINPNDISTMRIGYLISKFLILLSLPLWMFFSFLIIKGWQTRRIIRVGICL